jgi:hypothetical protein
MSASTLSPSTDGGGTSDRIRFFVPHHADGIEALPASTEDYWPWISRHRKAGEGKYSWTLQTYLHLRDAGFDCEIVHRFPDSGIVVAHRDFLPVFLRPRPGVFLVCLKPDRRAHTWSHYYVVQNPRDAIFRVSGSSNLASVLFSWPQPGLIPRSPARGATCRNVVYAGRDANLATELLAPAWAARLERAGFAWQRKPLERWHDFSESDIVVAARSFDARNFTNPIYSVDSKPPMKLINAWLAGVPAVVSVESAFRGVREHDLDYLEVKSEDELAAALARLRDDPALYRAMVAHGRARAVAFDIEAVRKAWMRALTVELKGRHEAWKRRGHFGRMSDSVVSILKYFSDADNLRSLLTIFK